MSDGDSVNDRLMRGEYVVVGDRLLGLCRKCGKVVRVNKWLFGSTHLCVQEEE